MSSVCMRVRRRGAPRMPNGQLLQEALHRQLGTPLLGARALPARLIWSYARRTTCVRNHKYGDNEPQKGHRWNLVLLVAEQVERAAANRRPTLSVPLRALTQSLR